VNVTNENKWREIEFFFVIILFCNMKGFSITRLPFYVVCNDAPFKFKKDAIPK